MLVLGRPAEVPKSVWLAPRTKSAKHWLRCDCKSCEEVQPCLIRVEETVCAVCAVSEDFSSIPKMRKPD